MPLLVKVIVYTVCFLAIAGMCMYGINKLYQYGWTGGYNKSEAAWLAKASEALGKKIDNLKEFHDVLTQRSIDHQTATEDLEREHAEDLEYAQLSKDMAIAAVLDGTVKLYKPLDPERIGRGDHCKGEIETGGITVCAPNGDDAEAVELHPKTAAFLFGLTLEADRNTDQLRQCQEYIGILEKSCGAQ